MGDVETTSWSSSPSRLLVLLVGLCFLASDEVNHDIGVLARGVLGAVAKGVANASEAFLNGNP